MQFTTFDKTLWNVKEIETIGYDKSTKTLIVKCLDGTSYTYSDVTEELIFKLVIAKDKDAFYRKNIKSRFRERPNRSLIAEID